MVTGLVRLIVFTVIIIGLPILLIRYGSPLPDHWPEGEDWRVLVTPPSEETIADLIVILGWVIWAGIITAIVLRIIRLTRETAPAPVTPAQQRWRIPGPARAVTAFLLGATATTAAANTLTTTPVLAAGTTTDTPDTHHDTNDSAATPATGHGRDRSTTYTVQAGDTLWDIADTQLGDPKRWEEILELNQNSRQIDGRRLIDADLIRPGWILHLPTTDTPPPHLPPPDPEEPTAPPAGDTPPPAPPATPPETTTPPPATTSRQTTDTTDSPDPVNEDGGFHLPTGAWIAAGLAIAIAASITLARARRNHHASKTATPPEPTRIPAPVHAILDAASEAPPDTEPGIAGIDAEGDNTTITTVTAGGLGITGPGSHSTARAFLATHLAGDHHGTPGTALISRTDLTALLPDGTALPDIPGRLITPEAHTITTAVHTEVLKHIRATDHHPDQTPANLLVITSDHQAAELAADHHDLGITVLVLGEWEPATATIATDGTITTGPEQTRLTRFHHLTDTDLAGILATFTDTATTTPPTPIPIPETHHATDPEPTPEPILEPPAPQTAGRAATITVFGPITVTANDTPITTGLRRKARELLAYLAHTHPHGATAGTLMEELLPATTMSKAPNHLRTLINNARTTLRTATNRDDTYIPITNDHYHLDPDVIDCDLWHFTRHLTNAANTTNPEDKITELTAATRLYTGDYAAGCLAEWTEPIREGLRNQAINAHTQLAELHVNTGNTPAALDTLDTACALAPRDEPLHQRAITAYLAAGRSDTALRLFRSLKQSLADIGAMPEQQTYGLFNDTPALSR